MKKYILATIILIFLVFNSLGQKFNDLFEYKSLDNFHLTIGTNIGSVKNSTLDDYIKAYNEVNAAKLSGNFKNFTTMYGYQMGFRYTILEMTIGEIHASSQEQSLSPLTKRVMDLRINYLKVYGSFPLFKGKLWLGVGMQTVKSIYSLALKYNNDQISYGKESNLSGNYKGLAANTIVKLEYMAIKREKHALGVDFSFSSVIKGTDGPWTDNNAAKGALNLSNSVTSTPMRTNFRMMMLGVNYYYNLGK